MTDTTIMLELIALQMFAEETSWKIDDLKLYLTLGTLGKDMYESMENDIVKRLAVTDAKLKELMRVMEVGY